MVVASIDLYTELRVEVDGGACVLRPVEFARFGDLIEMVGNGLFPDGPSTLAGWYEPDDLVRSARRTVAYHAAQLADATPESWTLPLGVWVGDTLIGVQGLEAKGFLVRREASTGSFLAPDWRGKGYGKLARRGILAAAFDELGAEWVVSAAYMDNHSSRGVSLAVGYERDGMDVVDIGGEARLVERFRISAERWRRRQQGGGGRVRTSGFDEFKARIGLQA